MRLPGSTFLLLLVLAVPAACDTATVVAPAASPSVAASSVNATALAASPGQPPAAASTAPPPVAALGSLPNPGLTPGETFSAVTAQQVCVSGYAGRARNVQPEQYRQVYAAYGIAYPQPAGTYELDHLVPLELGGDNSNRNLWPERALPVPGFHQKDLLENYLHEAVCAGRLTLVDAQARVATDWTSLYRLYLQP